MTLDTLLAQLETTQIVHRVNEAEFAYQFKHTLTQETVYHSLLRGKRREIHALVARAYEEAYADRLDEVAALLVQHYAGAGDDAKTLEFAVRAGDAAARLFANTEALEFYDRALEIARDSVGETLPATSLAELYLKRGRVLEVSGRHAEALQNYAEMETLGRERGDRRMELGALMARATIHAIPSAQHNPQLAQDLSDRALQVARELGDRPAEAKILWNLMLLNSRIQMRYQRALEYGEQSLVIARSLDLREQLAYTLNDIAPLYTALGYPDRARASEEESRALWRTMNNLPMLADNFSYATMRHLAAGEFEQAVTTAREAYELSRQINNPWGEAFSQTWVGQAFFELGRMAEAIDAMQLGIRAGADIFPPTMAITRSDLARLYGDLGKIDHGIELGWLAFNFARNIFPAIYAYTAGTLVHLYILKGDISQAAEVFAEGNRDLDEDAKISPFAGAVGVVECELAAAQADYPRALALIEEFIALQRRLQLHQYLPAVLLIKVCVLRAQGDQARAASALDQARAEAEAQQARWTLWRILAAQSKLELQRGNADQARATRAQAREHIDFIAAHTPPELRKSLLKLPDVYALLSSE